MGEDTLARLVRRAPLGCYFALVFALSGVALGVIGLPDVSGTAKRSPVALAMFPVMVVGVAAIAIALTAATEGVAGLRELRSRLRWPARRRWLLTLAIPPLAILGVLFALESMGSASYAPGFFVFGFAAGLLAGGFEELGWSGFAYPRMRARFGALGGALLLGVLWGLWHLPVIDSLGAASPHGWYWPEFALSFVAMITALRVLISWVYVNTGSVLMAQLMHASSTGFLVVLGAQGATPADEALWYLAYAGVLACVGLTVVAIQGATLCGEPLARLRARPAAASATIGS